VKSFGSVYYKTHFIKIRGANLKEANLRMGNLEGAYLSEAKNLTIDQLSKAKTLYNAELDEEILMSLKKKYPALFEEPKI
jgi:uncharacterized protein YjbI with pentapeptide repeats